MKRLVVYFHYDRQGIIDDACRFSISAMQQYGQLFFVTNGTLEKESLQWIAQSGADYLERENTGFDVGAYRDALYHIGREKIALYDEVLLMNYTLAGPICNLATMFNAMEARRELAFWGLTRHYAMRSRRFGGLVPEHLQSHFLAVRASLTKQDVFWKYWETMTLPRSYEESVICHETRFTKYFSTRGYLWDSYVNTADLKDIFVNPIMACPRELIENRQCPFFKRRSFFTPYADELRRTDGNAAAELAEYIQGKTAYPFDIMIRSLLRTQPLSCLQKNFHWRYLVDEETKPDTVDLSGTGLCLLHVAPLCGDGVTDWYLKKAFCWANQQLAQAVMLFKRNPTLGMVCPEVPAWPKAVQAAENQWKRCSNSICSVPVDQEPPPAPYAGWALVRLDALKKNEAEDLQALEELWRIPLQIQLNGYYSATFASVQQMASYVEQWNVYVKNSERLPALVRQIARVIKHRIIH